MENNAAYPELNKKWKYICKILLGEEIGELSEYGKWLYEGNGPRKVKKSTKSGTPVTFATQPYQENGKFMGLEEVDFEKKYEQFPLEGISDINSLVSAISGRVCYTGNSGVIN